MTRNMQLDVCILKEGSMSPLEETLKILIGKDLNVPAEKVTRQLVREWLERNPHPKSHLEFRSHYGGLRGANLRTLTDQEIEENRKKAEAFLEQFGPPEKCSKAG
jgi:hypothetical protein